MSIEKNKALVRRIFAEAINQGQVEIVDELFASNFIDHSTPEQEPGRTGVKEYFAQVLRGFPNMQVTINTLIGEGEMVAVRTTWHGTQRGEYEGRAATGEQVSRTLIQIFRVREGKIVEEWNEGDGLLKA